MCVARDERGGEKLGIRERVIASRGLRYWLAHEREILERADKNRALNHQRVYYNHKVRREVARHADRFSREELLDIEKQDPSLSGFIRAFLNASIPER